MATSLSPSESPSESPSISPSVSPSVSPSGSPSVSPSMSPSGSPSVSPSASPSVSPSGSPSVSPSVSPSASPSMSPSASLSPSMSPSVSPSISPSRSPSVSPSMSPSASPSKSPSVSPSASPSEQTFVVVESETYAPIRGTMVAKWEGLGIGGNDIGKEFQCPNFPIRSIQVVGTFGGASITLQGSNMIDSPEFSTLNDEGGSAITLSAAAIKQIRENTYWLRPVATSLGATTDLDVYVLFSTEK